MKQSIRVTDEQFVNMITESVMGVLNEGGLGSIAGSFIKGFTSPNSEGERYSLSGHLTNAWNAISNKGNEDQDHSKNSAQDKKKKYNNILNNASEAEQNGVFSGTHMVDLASGKVVPKQ